MNDYERKGKLVDSQVLYFEKANGNNVVHQLALTNKGEYPENQPKSFRSFFIKEKLDLLGIGEEDMGEE